MLAELGIRSYQITLYHRDGHAQHCLVETCLEDGRLIVDPTYGIYFTRPDGNLVSLKEMQSGVPPLFVPVKKDERCGYPSDPYYDFNYGLSKTADWTSTVTRRVAYRILELASSGAVDRLQVPAVLEWPQNIFIAMAAGLGISFTLLLTVWV